MSLPESQDEAGEALPERWKRDPVGTLQPLVPLLVACVGAVTALATIGERVLRGSKFQYFDYWNIINTTISDTGGFEVSNLLVLQNEHPVALARILYYLNFLAFGGSNVSLGVIVMGVVALQIILLLFNSPFESRIHRLTYGVGTVALVFAVGGVHNFQFAMSGAAWLTANLAAILAFHLMIRHRAVPAVLVGLIASASYGTGLLVWPALLVLSVTNPDRWKRQVPVVVVGWIISWGVYAMLYEPSPAQPLSFNPAGLIFRATSTLGGAFGTTFQTAMVFGALLVALGLFAASHSASLAKAPMNLALTIYGVLSAGLIALSRSSFGDTAGIASRYVSLSALVAIGVIGLLAVSFPRASFALVATLGLIASLAGFPRLDQYTTFEERNLEASIAVRLGTGAGYNPVFDARVTPKLVEIEHYPYNGAFDLDCGLLGENVDLPAANPESEQRVLLETVSPDPALQRFEGWLDGSQPLPDCLLILADDLVVGVGAFGGSPAALEPGGGELGFVALMPAGTATDIQIAGRLADGQIVLYGWS